MIKLLDSQKPLLTKLILTLIPIALLVSLLIALVYPANAVADDLVKPKGSAEADIAIWVPSASAVLPALITADYLPEANLPPGIKLPPGTIGTPFTFGLWQGDGAIQHQFDPSIVLNLKYQDTNVEPDILAQENTLHLQMYDPTTQAWVKLCSSVDIHANNLSAALATAVSYQEEGASLLVLAIDTSPSFEQTVDGQGTTTLSLQRSDLRLQVPQLSVAEGDYFNMTLLPKLPRNSPVKLLSRAVDIKACQTSQPVPTQNSRQITSFATPLLVSFDYDSEVLSRVGSANNLTIVQLQRGEWVDVEAVRAKVIRTDQRITLEVTSLGTFGLARR
jgi:hypothetical protein